MYLLKLYCRDEVVDCWVGVSDNRRERFAERLAVVVGATQVCLHSVCLVSGRGRKSGRFPVRSSYIRSIEVSKEGIDL